MTTNLMSSEDASACASLADSPRDAAAFEAAAEALEYYEGMTRLEGWYVIEDDVVLCRVTDDLILPEIRGSLRLVKLAVVEEWSRVE